MFIGLSFKRDAKHTQAYSSDYDHGISKRNCNKRNGMNREIHEEKNKKFHQHIEHLNIVGFEYEDYTILKPMMNILIEYSAI